VQTRLDVAHKLAESSLVPMGQIKLDAPNDDAIEDTVAAYFGIDDSAGHVALDE
jgi:hypothetical protein